MPLRLYGGTSSDFLTDAAGNWDGAGAYSVFADRALTTNITTSVTDKAGNPFAGNQPVADAVGLVEFTVPDTHTDWLWVATYDAAASTWREPVRVGPADMPTRVAGLEATTATSSALSAETAARQSADAAETSARIAADAAEAALRATGDTNEANTRAAADAAETARALAAEASEAATRAAADTSEASARSSADAAEAARALAAEAAISAAVSAVQASVTGILSGAPSAVDTFIETYNRFIADESVASALNTTVAGKLDKAANLSDVASPATALANLGGISTTAANAAYVPKDGQVYNVADHGLKGDTREISDVSVSSGGNILTAAAGTFTAADVGRLIAVGGVNTAGGPVTTSNNPITAVSGDGSQATMTKTAVLASVAARTASGAAMAVNAQAVTGLTAMTAADLGKAITIPNAGEKDRRTVSERCSTTNGQPTVTVPYAKFTSVLQGKRVRISRAGGGTVLYATVLSVDSTTQITLDTNASATVSNAMLEAWTIVDLVTVITRVDSATQVTTRHAAAQAVSGVTVSIAGHQAVVGTDDTAAWNALVQASPAGSTHLIPPNFKPLLGFGNVAIDRALTIRGATGSQVHLGYTSGRWTAASDDVTVENVTFRALQGNGAVGLFATGTVDHGYKNWKFRGCKFDGVSPRFQRVGSMQSDGTLLTSGTDFAGPVFLDHCEVTGILGDGAAYFVGLSYFEATSCWVHDTGQFTGSGDGIKVAACHDGLIDAGLIERCSSDGIDVYDSRGIRVSDVTTRRNFELGVNCKWRTDNDYGTPGQYVFIGVRARSNGQQGISCNAPNTIVDGCVTVGNGAAGIRVAVATDTNSAADPTRSCVISNVVTKGNNGDGVVLATGPTNAALSNIQAHDNAVDGVNVDGSGHRMSNVIAFDNVTAGIGLAATAAGVSLSNCNTQDADGVCTAATGATYTVTGSRAPWGIPRTADAAEASAGVTMSANTTRWFRVKEAGYISKIRLQVTASSGNIVVQVWSPTAAGVTGKPHVLKASSGSVACPAIGVADVSLGGTVFAAEGDFFALGADNATAAIMAGREAPTTTTLSDGQEWGTSGTFPVTATDPAVASITGRRPILIGVA